LSREELMDTMNRGGPTIIDPVEKLSDLPQVSPR